MTTFIVFNAHREPMRFTLPRGAYGQRWSRVLDTGAPPALHRAGAQVPVQDRSLAVQKKVS